MTAAADFTAALDRIAALADAFAEAARDAAAQDPGLAQPVAGCPGWTALDLVDHLSGIHRWAAAALGSERAPRLEDRPEREAPVEWYRASAAHLVAALRAAGPEAPAWTLWDGRTAAFWARRQVHELAVHTFDLLEALGRASAWQLPEDLALDGIREVLDGFYPRQVRLGRSRGLPGVVRLEVTHDDGRPAASLVLPAASPGEGGEALLGTVTGSAREVYLGLWGRRPLPDTAPELARVIHEARLVP
ncbi:maleylpyruvate isomerase family mycothiol-dependent enzyme [Sinomonas sp. RB5]